MAEAHGCCGTGSLHYSDFPNMLEAISSSSRVRTKHLISQLVALPVAAILVLCLLFFSGNGVGNIKRPPYADYEQNGMPILPLNVNDVVVSSTAPNSSFGEVRAFLAHGVAAHLFVHVSSYRNSPRAISTIGLISQEILEKVGVQVTCKWKPQNVTAAQSTTLRAMLKQWNWRGARGYYESVLILCVSDEEDVGADSGGGELLISISTGKEGWHVGLDEFAAFKQAPGEYNASIFHEPFPYEFAYCGAPLYGSISPQRIREWVAYHTHLFGERGLIILYDLGGLHPDVMKVLQPWIDLGRVSIQNIRQSVLYKGYVNNHFSIINDCLLRTQFMAKWTFSFDIDEFVYLDPNTTLSELLAEKERDGLTIVQFDQKHMANDICFGESTTLNDDTSRKWSIESHVFRNWAVTGAYKYVAQTRKVILSGVHGAVQLWEGRQTNFHFDRIWFHHYHGIINRRHDSCAEYKAGTGKFTYKGDKHTADFTMAKVVESIKQYEKATIGEQPFIW